MDRLGRVFAEAPLLDLFGRIIHAHRPGDPRGLPIGSLISQHCANLFLDRVDRLVTGALGQGAYVRYMDDFVVWGNDKHAMRETREAVRQQEHAGQPEQQPRLPCCRRAFAARLRQAGSSRWHGMDFPPGRNRPAPGPGGASRQANANGAAGCR